MNKVLLQICMLLFLCSTALAQTRSITGQVNDKDNLQPLIGVSVSVKGTTQGGQTDVKGKFTITGIKNGSVILVVKYIGYKQKDVTVGANQSNVAVELETDAQQLDEVVAIGYQNVKRRDVNGAVSSVSAKQLKDIPVSSLGEALAGRLAGVQITQSEGSPDAAFRVLVRGGGSITQSNDPLYVIDGVQVENGLATLSPQDIESIDVLKDAASTAIYGARGSNGVVIITTKGGRTQPTTVTYNAHFGFKRLARELPVLDPYNFVTYEYERSRGNATDSTNFANDYGNSYAGLAGYQSIPVVDWQKKIFNLPSFQQQHNIAITGGNASTSFNLSFTDDNQTENVINSKYDRKLLNFHLDHTASDHFKFGFSGRYSQALVSGVDVSSTSSSTYNNLRNTIKYLPFDVPGVAEDQVNQALLTESNLAGNNLGLLNPIVSSNAQYRTKYTYLTDLSGFMNYSFNKYLSFRSTLGVDFNRQVSNNFDDAITYNAQINGLGQPLGGINQVNLNTLDLSNVITYSNAASNPKKHNFSVILGNEFYNVHSEGINTQFKLFPTGIAPLTALNQLNQGTIVATYPQNAYAEAHLLSFFGRATYTFDKKYTAVFSFRADASSKFNPNNQTSYFPSGSLTWRVSDEPFMKNVTAISDLKLRFSHGASGNNRIGDYQATTLFTPAALYSLNESTTTLGYTTGGILNNPNLKWETTTSNNLGIDFGLFKGRIQASIDAYQGTTKDLLILVPIPPTSGYNRQYQNVGSTQNRGIEFQMSSTVLQKKDFSWTVNFNISYNTNKVLALAPGQNSAFYNSGWGVSGQPADFILQVGQPVGTVYGYVSDGFYTTNDFNYNAANNQYTLKAGVVDPSKLIGTAQPGLVKLKDLNGDNVITTADQQILGNTIPKITGGLNQTFTYKNFDASVFVNFQDLVSVLNASKVEFSNGYTANTNLLGAESGRWRTVDGNGNVIQKIVTVGGVPVAVGSSPDVINGVNGGATLPIPVTGPSAFYVNSSDVENGAFARVNNITLGYSFKAAFLRRIGVKKLRLYATGNNLALFTNYTGYDPEVNTRTATPVTPGVDYSAYPRARTYFLGINLTL